MVQEFADLRFVGAVARLEEEFDREGAIDQAGDRADVVGRGVAQGVVGHVIVTRESRSVDMGHRIPALSSRLGSSQPPA